MNCKLFFTLAIVKQLFVLTDKYLHFSKMK